MTKLVNRYNNDWLIRYDQNLQSKNVKQFTFASLKLNNATLQLFNGPWQTTTMTLYDNQI